MSCCPSQGGEWLFTPLRFLGLSLRLRLFCSHAVAALCFALVFSCGGGKGLEVHQVLGRTAEELEQRWGKPDISMAQSPEIKTLQWKNLEELWVYVVCRGGQVCYVTYTFQKMAPFDSKEALRRIGLEVPREAPEHTWENGAKRWMPFGLYEKLTLNPQTKAVSVGVKEPLGSAEE